MDNKAQLRVSVYFLVIMILETKVFQLKVRLLTIQPNSWLSQNYLKLLNQIQYNRNKQQQYQIQFMRLDALPIMAKSAKRINGSNKYLIKIQLNKHITYINNIITFTLLILWPILMAMVDIQRAMKAPIIQPIKRWIMVRICLIIDLLPYIVFILLSLYVYKNHQYYTSFL